jgi:predicted dehydrogenase
MERIKIGIIGCGAAAKRYYVPTLRRYANTHKIFMVDKNIDNAKKISMEFGTGEVYDDYTKIIKKVDGVIVALPHSLHYPVSMDFLREGVTVLCEKPLAESVEQAEEMVNAATTNNAALLVNNTRRIFPSFKETKRLIEEGAIGKLELIEYFEANKFEWESETNFYTDPQITSKGILLDLGAHVLDLVCWWLGAKPELLSYEDDSFGGPESYAYVRAEKNNCDIKVRLNRLVDIGSHFIVKGSLGIISGTLSDWRSVRVKMNTGVHKNVQSKTSDYNSLAESIVENFIDVLRSKEKPLINGESVIDSIKLIDECYRNRSQFIMPWYKNLETLF